MKKYNKSCPCAPFGKPLAALPLLVASPLLHSGSLQLLFQRAAKWRSDGTAGHPCGSAGALPGPPSPFLLPRQPPSPPHQPLPALSLLGARPVSAPMPVAQPNDEPESPTAATAAVRCDGCVRCQRRYVVLGCSHTFCWGCVAMTALRAARRAESPPSPTSALTAGLPPGSPTAALRRRVSVNEAVLREAAAAAGAEEEGGGFECPVCDALHDLDGGHLEVNALMGDASYVWVLAPSGEGRRGRRVLSRSRLMGMDFSTLASSLGSGAHPLRPALGSLGGGLGRVPSWTSMALTQGGGI